jgi:fucokinase
VKSTITAPGIPQRPVVESLALSDSLYKALEDRLVVYFSGQQRLARDILRRVVGRWLGREPAAVMLNRELKESATELRNAMLKGRWLVVGREIARYWRIKKDLFPGSTTPSIDVLFLELKDHYLAAGLAGAGGGGFAYFFCRDARQANQLRQLLAERANRPGMLGNVYETQINRTGLSVSRKSVS